MSVAGSDIVLRAEAITKVFPGTVALSNVDFNVHRGKVNVLIGENGAGKSTLVKVIAGVEQPSSGRLMLDGHEVTFPSTREADAAGIGMIHQELNLCSNLTAAENIFLARERTRGPILIDKERETREAAALISRLEPSLNPRATVADLWLGEQQIVEIAKALARHARILIMDEPTSALSGAEVNALFRVIRELTAEGISIVYISHRLEELLRIGDHITVLRDGRRVDEAPASQVDLGWIVNRMVGGKLENIFARSPEIPGDVCLEVRSLSMDRVRGGPAFQDVCFQLRRGEVLGIYGLMGAGRTELMEALIGLRPEVTGDIRLDGKNLVGSSVARRIRSGLALVPEDRQGSGIVPMQSVLDNMILSSLHRFRSGPYLDHSKARSQVESSIRELAIRVANIRQPIDSLSGGNQQKVVIAKGLLNEPKVLLLDEPTRGVDVGAKAEICRIISRLVAAGLGILLVSSELEEIRGMADRVLVMSKGKITAELARSQATDEALVRAASANLISRAGGQP
jgi:erythritol transport system ATP-binding protein